MFGNCLRFLSWFELYVTFLVRATLFPCCPTPVHNVFISVWERIPADPQQTPDCRGIVYWFEATFPLAPSSILSQSKQASFF